MCVHRNNEPLESDMTLERISTGHFYVMVNGARIAHVWKGCGGWAGSRYAGGIEATGRTAKEVATKLAAKTS